MYACLACDTIVHTYIGMRYIVYTIHWHTRYCVQSSSAHHVAQGVHVQLHRAVQVLVHQHRVVLVNLHGERDVPGRLVVGTGRLVGG
jgi:hypothetical protein